MLKLCLHLTVCICFCILRMPPGKYDFAVVLEQLLAQTAKAPCCLHEGLTVQT